MASADHQNEWQKDETKPEFTKKISEQLSVSLSYINQKSQDSTECLISFHNTSIKKLHINPGIEYQGDEETDGGWFSGIFGAAESTTSLMVNSETNDVTIFLGYIQLFGFVMLNYKFGLTSSTGPIEASNNFWWYNKEYANYYQDDNDDTGELSREEKLDSVPFIREHLEEPLIIGGKLGGITDLSIESKNSNIMIDQNTGYLLSDLLYTFNSRELPQKDGNSKEQVPLRELTDSIIPIYSTSQHLLFADLTLRPQESKTYRIQFSKIKDMPPSYNTRSTGPMCDQGWVSIKYSLILGWSSNQSVKPTSVYFPLDVKPDRIGSDRRWLQKDYLQDIKFRNNWDVLDLDVKVDESFMKIKLPESIETRNIFLKDLSKLIDSDLYNMPKTSTTERNKSIHSLDEYIEDALIAQLPTHLKTQYQIRVNKYELCLLSLAKPYFHLGEEIKFTIDVNPDNNSTTKVVGLIGHLEAHEYFHLKGEKSNDFVNIFKVTPNIKFNCFSTAMIASHLLDDEKTGSLITGSIFIPSYLTSQFQSSGFMSLKYFLVFKFIMMDFDSDEKKSKLEPLVSYGSNTVDREEVQEPIDSETQANESREEIIGNIELFSSNNDNFNFGFIDNYKYDNYGSEMTFRLPLYILP